MAPNQRFKRRIGVPVATEKLQKLGVGKMAKLRHDRATLRSGPSLDESS